MSKHKFVPAPWTIGEKAPKPQTHRPTWEMFTSLKEQDDRAKAMGVWVGPKPKR